MPPGAAAHGDRVLRLAPGATVPLHIDLDSALLAIAPSARVDMTLLQPLEIALRDGQPEGRYRIAEGAWHAVRDGVLHLRIDRVAPGLGDDGPQVRMHGRIDLVESGGARR